MTIKEVSKKYGITQDALRYYERVSMIPSVTRTTICEHLKEVAVAFET